MPTATVVRTNPDGSIVVRTDMGEERTIQGNQLKALGTSGRAWSAAGHQTSPTPIGPQNTSDPSKGLFYLENARFPKLGRGTYDAYNFLSELLPTVGGMVGGPVGAALGGPFAAMGTAGAGVMTADQIRTRLNELMYKGVGRESTGQEATRLGLQFGLGAGTEGVAQAASLPFKGLIKPMEASAKTIAAAEAGKGVRLLPGEAGDLYPLKLGESIIGHLPGGGPIKTFRVAQEADIAAGEAKIKQTFQNQLNVLDSRNLTSEEAGKEVQLAVKKAEADAAQSQGVYSQVKEMLRLPPNATKDEIEAAIASREKIFPGTQANADVRATLAQADKLYRAESKRVVNGLVQQVLDTDKPEVIGGFFQNAGLQQLRDTLPTLPPQTQGAIARNVLENMLMENGQFSGAKLAKELGNLGAGSGGQTAVASGQLIFKNQYADIVEASKLLSRLDEQIAPIGRGSDQLAGRIHIANMISKSAIALGGAVGLGVGGPIGLIKTVGAETAFARIASLALTNPQTSAKALNALRIIVASTIRGIVPSVVNELGESTPAIPRITDWKGEAPDWSGQP